MIILRMVAARRAYVLFLTFILSPKCSLTFQKYFIVAPRRIPDFTVQLTIYVSIPFITYAIMLILPHCLVPVAYWVTKIPFNNHNSNSKQSNCWQRKRKDNLVILTRGEQILLQLQTYTITAIMIIMIMIIVTVTTTVAAESFFGS